MPNIVDTPSPVRSGETLDGEKLLEYLTSQLPNTRGPLVVEQFPQGFSNLTYLIRLGDLELVLRRPPFGNTVKSAHDMGREFRVLSKLSAVYPLAPKPLAYCEEDSVLGAPFYVMERRRGVILRKSPNPDVDLSPAVLQRLGISLIDNFADLHKIDYASAGLSDLGKPQGYIERQVGGWAKRYEGARTDEIPDVETVITWLQQNMPSEGAPSLIHNDYKFDNLVLDPQDITRIIAVLDWEMCTIGDPLMDLGMSLAYWVDEGDDIAVRQFIAGPTNLPGSMTRRALLRRYRERTGRDTSKMLFFYTFGLFKLAVIIQQIYARYARGFTKDPRFAKLNGVVESLFKAAVQAIDYGDIPGKD